MPVVIIKMLGPTRANIELSINAFSKSLDLNINPATVSSILPDMKRNKTIYSNAASNSSSFQVGLKNMLCLI